MSFLNNIVNQFTHQGQGQGQGQGGGQYGQQQQYGQQYPPQHSNYNGPPQPPAPWIAEWDNQQNRWMYINRETGQRTHEFPQGGYQQNYGGGGQGYGGQGYGGQGYGQQQYNQGPPPQQQKQSHTGRNVALGAAAGIAGGMLLAHEGEKVHEHFEEDKYRVEERFDRAEDRVAYDTGRAENWGERKFDDGVNDVENFPDNAARWAGNKVEEVEQIPEDLAYDVGDGVGRLDRFDDRIEDSYDEGRNDNDNDGW